MAVEVGSHVARSVVETFVGRNKVSLANPPSPKVIEPFVGRDGDVDIEDPCWQLFYLEHGIDPALAAWSFADRPEMLHAEGPDEHGDEGHRPHRDPYLVGVWSALVTRLIPANSPEFHSEPCVAALDKERGTLRTQAMWNEDGVREWRSVRNKSGADGKDDLVERLFAIMDEKNAEDGVWPHLRRYKASKIFAHSNI